MPETADRQHIIRWEDPMIGAKTAQSLSGYDYLLAMAKREVSAPPISFLMNMRLTEVEVGRAVFEAEPAEYHYNPIGTVHGGFAAAVLDSALGCAVHSTLPAGVGYSTLELHINYLRPLTTATGIVYCEGKIIHAGKRTATAEARLTDASGKLYAHGTTTCIILGQES